jgi:hypothetical protein
MLTVVQMALFSGGLSGQFCSSAKSLKKAAGAFDSSITGGLAIVAAVILPAEEFTRFGVDGDALAIGPVAVRNADDVAAGLEGGDSFLWEAGLNEELVRLVLVVEAWGVDRLLDIEAALSRGEEDVGDGSNDACAAGGAEDVA